ncbi:hypothetical protein T439DRAFT_98997 [Meredithblackwellia eburnea MCA 4105]
MLSQILLILLVVPLSLGWRCAQSPGYCECYFGHEGNYGILYEIEFGKDPPAQLRVALRGDRGSSYTDDDVLFAATHNGGRAAGMSGTIKKDWYHGKTIKLELGAWGKTGGGGSSGVYRGATVNANTPNEPVWVTSDALIVMGGGGGAGDHYGGTDAGHARPNAKVPHGRIGLVGDGGQEAGPATGVGSACGSSPDKFRAAGGAGWAAGRGVGLCVPPNPGAPCTFGHRGGGGTSWYSDNTNWFVPEGEIGLVPINQRNIVALRHDGQCQLKVLQEKQLVPYIVPEARFCQPLSRERSVIDLEEKILRDRTMIDLGDGATDSVEVE